MGKTLEHSVKNGLLKDGTPVCENQRMPTAVVDRKELLAAYRSVRGRTEELCRTLQPEDFAVQSMEDASPAKWHLGHTAWFFEAVVLPRFAEGRAPFDERFHFLFNSYYESLGERWARPRRGLLVRPAVREVLAYRRAVDQGVAAAVSGCPEEALPELSALLELGLAHEEQHQELLLTDLKHLFALNPLKPAFRPLPAPPPAPNPAPPRFKEFAGGLREIGWKGGGFAYDNEKPRHKVHLEPFALADRPVTNGDFLSFMEDGGYRDPRLWLSDGWARAQAEGWQAPLYWERDGSGWALMTLGGPRPVDPAETLAHVSYFEAAAFARWAGARLPTEAEWEAAAEELGAPGANFQEDGLLHPARARSGFGDLLGGVWEWTASAYLPYPGYREYDGALGEYNGKFMSGQMVLRGGSCATPRGHVRTSYRNFFQPEKRWQFSGLRLAK